MSDQGFGLASVKYEGDTVDQCFEKVSHACPIVHHSQLADKIAEGLFFVIFEDGQPFTMYKKGEVHFVMHQDKDIANSKYKLSSVTKFKRYLKGLFND